MIDDYSLMPHAPSEHAVRAPEPSQKRPHTPAGPRFVTLSPALLSLVVTVIVVAGAVSMAWNGLSLTVAAELLYQSIGYRWAENLRAYPAPETERFTRFYELAAAGSAMSVAHATAVVADTSR